MKQKHEVLYSRRASAYAPASEIRFYKSLTGESSKEAYIQLVYLDGPKKIPVYMEFYKVRILAMTGRIQNAMGAIKSRKWVPTEAMILERQKITSIWQKLKVQCEISNIAVKHQQDH